MSASPEQSHLRIVRSEDRLEVRGAQPVGEQRAVDAAEIDGVLDVSFVEIRKTRVFSKQAALDGGAGDKQTRGLAVVGAGAGVFRHTAAELGEGHDHHALVVSLLFQIGEERFQRAVKLS